MMKNPFYFILKALFVLKIFNPSRPDPERREKINLNFYFHTSLWYLKRFYEGLKGLGMHGREGLNFCLDTLVM